MPFWAKRFHQIWDKLTEAQSDALMLEWFYESDEKPTQEENALVLGISVDSYKERLKLANKKLGALYPEFPRLKRKKPRTAKKAIKPAPLYQILPTGEKVELEISVMRKKTLSTKENHEIKKWVYESTMNYMFRFQAYTDVDDFEDEEEQEAVEEYIEKEHQDYMRLKAEESEQKLKG